MYTNELYHYGIKGMKWGVRRYQNADGSLTSAGKSKYKSDKAAEKLIDADAKYGSKRNVNQQIKINKLYKKFDKASDKDIKRALKIGDDDTALKYSAGRTYMKMLMDNNFRSMAMLDAQKQSHCEIGKQYTHEFIRDDKLGGVILRVNGNDNLYIYDPSNNIVGK